MAMVMVVVLPVSLLCSPWLLMVEFKEKGCLPR